MTQVEYIEILFNDLRFNLAQKKDFLWIRYGVQHSDELDTKYRGKVIDELKAMKEVKREENKREEVSGWDE